MRRKHPWNIPKTLQFDESVHPKPYKIYKNKTSMFLNNQKIAI